MLEKNSTLTVTIENVDSMMNGVAHAQDSAIFIPGALQGEVLDVQIVRTAKTYAFARIVAIKSPALERVTPPCPYYKQCGGCAAQHMTYETSLSYKQDAVAQALKRIGGVDIAVPPVVKMDDPFHYRNKTAMPVCDMMGNPRAGFYALRSHRLVPIKSCMVSMHPSDLISQTVIQWMEKFHLPAYNEVTHAGLIRHIISRVSTGGESMAVIVATTRNVPYQENLVDMLRSAVPNLKSICLSVNTRFDNVILGNNYQTLFGSPRIKDTLCGFTYALSPLSFFQINPVQTERLYECALQFADVKSTDTVVDLYCGAGTISLLLAKKARHVVGIEIVREAILDAQENARVNGVQNVSFHAAPAEELLPELLSKGLKPDVVVLDPPRKGAEESALRAILSAAPKRIVYVSCDPATLSRDVKFLTANGYAANKVQPFDMFPWTAHVETIVLLSHKNS